MRARKMFVVLGALALVLGACGDDDVDTTTDDTTLDDTTVDDTATDDTATDDTATDDTATDDGTTTSEPTTLGQPAIWPAPDVVFDTPDAAAEDFVTEVLGVPAVLGEFQQGDSRSGEMVVLFAGEDGEQEAAERGLLFLRQLGPDDGWFVIGAVSEGVTITEPETMAEVEAGPLTVSGEGYGFEANLVVSAIVAGDADAVLDELPTMGGNFGEPAPYSAEVDLSGASTGDTVMILVRGGTGLETDPGDFAAVPVVVA